MQHTHNAPLASSQAALYVVFMTNLVHIVIVPAIGGLGAALVVWAICALLGRAGL